MTGGPDPNTIVDSIVIEGVDPWTFDVAATLDSRALLDYTINFIPGWPCGGPTADINSSEPTTDR